jgi:glycine/D-amino acid oxidase-like deaminating enzyme
MAARLTTEADAVVIGGGIPGCATAYYLAKRKAKVILLDKSDIAGGQSGRNWGFVRQQGRDPRELPLMMASNKMWPTLSEELEADIEWVQGGNLVLAADHTRLAELEQWVKLARDFNLDTVVLSNAQIRERIPGIGGTWAGGMYTRSDGHADPKKTTSAFATAAQRYGATIQTSCTVTDIEVTGGRVSAVVTEQGVIKTPIILCAAGASSRALAKTVGLSLPQLVVRETVTETVPVAPLTDIAVWAENVAFRQRRNGRLYVAPAGNGDTEFQVTLSAFRDMRMFLPNYLKNRQIFRIRVGRKLLREVAGALLPFQPWKRAVGRERDEEPTPNMESIARARRNFASLLPSLAGIEIARSWAGDIDTTPDAVPVLGGVDSPKGFYFATGFSGHGFAMGPIVGRLMAELILDGAPSLDITPLRFSRFREGDLAGPKSIV